MSMAIARAKYTGDPGFFGDIWGGIKKIAAPAVSMIPIIGNPLSQIIGRRQPPIPTAGPGGMDLSGSWGDVATRYGLGSEAAARAAAAARGGIGVKSGAYAERMMPGIIPAFQRAVPGGASGMGPAMNGMMGGPGYHLNKSGYFLLSGQYVPAGTKWVKNRKRNPANARATSRAISRISGAKKYQHALGRISIRKKC